MLTIPDNGAQGAFVAHASRLIELGYSPVPLLQRSKRPYIDKWQHWCNRQMTPNEIATVMPDANLGLACGAFTTSIDIDDDEVMRLIGPELLLLNPVSKVGRDGRTDIFRSNPDAPQTARKWKSKRDANGNRRNLIEMLANGNQTVLPPSIHPDTAQPYRWVGDALWDVPLADLPMMHADLGAWIEGVLLANGLIDDPAVELQRREARNRSMVGYEQMVSARRPIYEAYAVELLERKCAGLRALSSGRHGALIAAATAVSPYVSLGLLDEQGVEAALRGACEANGFFERELHARSRGANKEFHRQVNNGLSWGEGLAPVELRRTVEEMFGRKIAPAPKTFLARSGAEALASPDIPATWALDQWILGNNVTLLAGNGGSGKSLTMLQLMMYMSEGVQFMGKRTRKGPTLYISGEDEQEEIDRRIKAVRKGLPFAKFENFHTICLAEMEDPSLYGPYGEGGMCVATEMLQAIEDEIARLRPVAVVLDPLADLFGGNEIDRKEVRAFISMLRKMAREYDCAIIIIGHPSVDGMKTKRGYSGSTAWNNSVRSRINFEQSEDSETPDRRTMTLAKANRAKAGEIINMDWQDGYFKLGKVDAIKAKRDLFDEIYDDVVKKRPREMDGYAGTDLEEMRIEFMDRHHGNHEAAKKAWNRAKDKFIGEKGGYGYRGGVIWIKIPPASTK